MAGLTERLALIVDANTRGATRGLDNLGRSAKTNLGEAEKGVSKFTRSLRDAGPVIGAVAAGAGAAFLSLANSAKGLSSATAAVNSTFGAASDGVKQFAEDAEALGLSQTEASQLAAQLGGSLQSVGFSATEAGGQVEALTQRAADMAVGLGTTEEALGAIAALLRGERDPIERFGVAIKQVDVNARVAALGLDTSTAAAKKNAEATAALELLFEQTANKAGTYGSEANRAAREQGELTAKLENLQAEIGMKVLPAFVELVSGLSDSIDKAQELSAGVGLLVDDMQVLAENVSVAGVSLGGAGGLGDQIGKVLSNAGGLVGVFRDAGRGLEHYADEAERVARLNELADRTLDLIADGFNVVAVAATRAGDAVGSAADFINGALDNAEETAGKYESLFSAAFGVQDALAGIDDGSSDAAKAHDALSDAQRGAVEAAEAVRDAQMDVAEAMAATFDATEAARQGFQDYAAEQRAATDPIFAFIRALERQEELLGTASGPGVDVVRRDRSVTANTVDKPSALDVAQGAAGVEQAAINLAGGIQTGTVSVEKARASLRRYQQQGLITEKQFASLSNIIEDAAAKAMDLEGSNVELAISSEVAAERAEFEAEKTAAVQEARERLEDANQRLVDAQERVRDATDKVSRSQENAVLKAEALDRAMFELHQEVKDNPGLILDAKAKLDDWVQRGLIPASTAATTLRDLVNDVNNALDQFGEQDGGSIDFKVAADISALINATDDPKLKAALERMWRESMIRGIGELNFISNLPGYIGDVLSGRASGGPVSPNETYMVGERGPELLRTGSAGGFVFNANQTRGMVGSGGSSRDYSIIVNNPTGQTTESSIRRELDRAEHLTGAR